MFDFEKLDVYQKARSFNSDVYKFIQSGKPLDSITKNQLRRAALSVMLHIAEGSSRFSKPDRKNFYVIARGSVFECVAVFDFMKEHDLLNENLHREFYTRSEELSKMIYAMIRNLS